MRRFRHLHDQTEQSYARDADPAGQRRSFVIADHEQEKGEGEKLHQHLGHESLAEENAERRDHEQEIGPEGLRRTEEASPNELQANKRRRPERDRDQLAAQVEIPDEPVEADHEIIVER